MKKEFLVLLIAVTLVVVILITIPLTRTGKFLIVKNFSAFLTNWANSVLEDSMFQKFHFLFYTINVEQTGAVTIYHPGFSVPLFSDYTEQKQIGILFSPDGQPKGVTQSLAHPDFCLSKTTTGWQWEEDPSCGDNAMYLVEIISGWFYYEWHW